MGMDDFAPYPRINGCFIVKNISAQIKTINIFQYPINYLDSRDLLLIPGVSEGDIRSSLLKGELNHKIRAGDIQIICSDIDLLQFNADQKTFLTAAGVVNGMTVGASQQSVLQMTDVQLDGLVDGSNRIYTIPSGHWLQAAPYKIVVYLNGVRQKLNDDYTIQENGGFGTGYNQITMTLAPKAIPTPVDVVSADYCVTNT